jgi:hypothetical protein
MICEPCKAAADAGNLQHGETVCEQAVSCTCQHGYNLECDPDPNGFGGYLDALPENDPRRLAYEARVGGKIQR